MTQKADAEARKYEEGIIKIDLGCAIIRLPRPDTQKSRRFSIDENGINIYMGESVPYVGGDIWELVEA